MTAMNRQNQLETRANIHIITAFSISGEIMNSNFKSWNRSIDLVSVWIVISRCFTTVYRRSSVIFVCAYESNGGRSAIVLTCYGRMFSYIDNEFMYIVAHYIPSRSIDHIRSAYEETQTSHLWTRFLLLEQFNQPSWELCHSLRSLWFAWNGKRNSFCVERLRLTQLLERMCGSN